ncbi:hypothetical protein SPRG_07167 [Saprolegnia parasitica CBS 223.65]|uniref:Glycolipid transfer protein domain-containing protein n=1 Tax=Saprolegnia parasitica (strain CBS 223.65) TaxID=695850 RepID=A0A067CAV0_SAPPC|nr:hypothetical protein SPRG_07167 [Saprolegnia parasitica CBS 223.65]KDO27894.1 hypothetical protein SPRG_07167 [Saprolegnia parasitica CBS 223.65]|eukprot:XP_012201351.1 hypothetical protein SPRG_07167 [Saprolegnia parasitica CBS 223.65]
MEQPRSPSPVPRRSPSDQIEHLTQHMSMKVATSVLAEMKLRSRSTVSMARGDSYASSNSSSNGDDDSSDGSSPETSPMAAVAPLRSPRHADPEAGDASSTEALLMPGKAFLQSFYAFLKEHRKSLRQRNPRLQVVLNPPCLHYLEHCFYAMLLPLYGPDATCVLQWETKKDAPEVTTDDAPRGMSKTQRMLKLAGFVLHIVDLHIQTLPDSLCLPSQCNLGLFSSLLYLRLDSMPLDLIQGLWSFKKQLLELTLLHIPLRSVADVLGSIEPYEATDAGSPIWSSLTSLGLIDCGLTKLDAALALAPSLTQINLSSNMLTSLSHLENCPQLSHVNVSGNALLHLDGAHRSLANVTSLVLHTNALASVKGIAKMYGLQTLDLGHNAIPSLSDVAPLAALPLLQYLTLTGNPFEVDEEAYRCEVLQLFGKDVLLDSEPWTPSELQRGSFQRRKSLAVVTEVDCAPMEPPSSDGRRHHEARWHNSLAPAKLHDVVARVGMTCVLLVVAQAIATCLWARDEESETFTTLVVSGIGGTVLLLALPLSLLTYVLQQAHLTSPPAPPASSMGSPKPPLSPRMQRELAANHMFPTEDDDDEADAMRASTSTACSLSVWSTALEVLVDNAEHMPLQDFLAMCRETAGLLHLLGPTGAFALKSLTPELARLDIAWRNTAKDADVTLQALMGAEAPDTDGRDDVTSTVLRIVPVLAYVKNLCLEMEKDRDLSLRHCASKAYLTSLAKQQKHAWLVQKAVLSAMQLNPMTRESLVGLWRPHDGIDDDDDDAEASLIEERLHACGHMLDIVLRHLETWYESL